MKRLISLILVSIFIASGLQVGCHSSFYDDYNYNPPYVYQQPMVMPVVVPTNPTPIVINNNPSASATSESSNGVSVQKILKWGIILGGLAYVYSKFGNSIISFISGLPQKVSEFFENHISSKTQQESGNLDNEASGALGEGQGQSYFEKSINSLKITVRDFLNTVGALSVFSKVVGFLTSDKPLGSFL